ncbi:MAG TPA: hypothetical protein VLD39_08080 [Gammaproteobacteria bacterium]|nr:hypothetical protein [Gammaproteobacteria bacterium]
MHRIASFHSGALAHLTAAHLREHGVMAGVIDATMSAVTSVMGGSFNQGAYELVIASRSDEERAHELLETLKQNPPTIDPDWEEDVAPDLSLLDKKLIPDCPGCKWPVSVARPLGPCQRCGTKYDVLEMIFERHGPEALAACYETEAPMANLSDEQVCDIAIDCPSCDYPLDGLGVRGTCPECGAHFDRRELFNGLLGH